jgi:PTH1 family peptidyl-tRNA hydrolase
VIVVTMQLIVGLGNPGPKYIHTRHNIGFVIADAIAARTRLQLSEDRPTEGKRSRWTAWLRTRPALATSGQSIHGGQHFTLVKPLTFMNRSGAAVAHYVQTMQLDVQDVLVMFDDISLPVGAVRLRKKGGDGGHNGVQDIIDQLGTSEFPRLRFGVGNDFDHGQQVDYVLSPFADGERETVDSAVTEAVDAVLTCIQEGMDIAMNRFNRRG